MNRTTTVTERNIHTIYGKIKRFFYNKTEDEHVGFTMHHNFDCGWKNIKPYNVNKERIFKPDCVDLVHGFISTKERFIKLILQEEVSGFVIKVGDKVQFNGNRFILQSKWLGTGYNYSYEVFERVELSESDLYDIHHRRCDDAYYASICYNNLDE